MDRTLTIAKREFRGYFNSPAAYIVVCLFLLLLGFFFWSPFFLANRASVRGMFDLMSVLLLPTAPAMTMGLLSEEKRTGTIEVLLTMPVRDSEVILGKFLGALSLLSVLLLLTVAYPLSVSTLGTIDWGPILTGYLALLLQGSAMLAIGVLASSWTDNQLIAFFVAGMMCFALWIVSRFLPFIPQQAAGIIEWISFDYHFRNLVRGVIDTRNVFYFLSVIGLALAMAFRSLESRRWS
ncbi:MAG: ABC transporter permease subunit [Myxococcales bacterium]|nr:ABC transporter permease subunit [Myxococcales bacterium]MDD9970091.1 ABC transporter permease subunit [Myxococcales bacterium]